MEALVLRLLFDEHSSCPSLVCNGFLIGQRLNVQIFLIYIGMVFMSVSCINMRRE